MLVDKGAAHVLAKDRKLIETRFQRIARGLIAEVKRRTIGKIGDAFVDDIETRAAGLLPGDATLDDN